MFVEGVIEKFVAVRGPIRPQVGVHFRRAERLSCTGGTPYTPGLRSALIARDGHVLVRLFHHVLHRVAKEKATRPRADDDNRQRT